MKFAGENDRTEIKEANSAEELEAIFRFRYRIYVKEMGRQQDDADHAMQRVQDRLDTWGRNFFAMHKGHVAATIRGNFWRDGSDAYYDDVYLPHDVGSDHPQHTCMVTRLMVVPEQRGSGLVLDLFLWLYEYAMQHGLRWIFIDCNDWLIPFFSRFGFMQYRTKVMHKEYGLVTPMRANLFDRDHLVAIQSPWLPALDSYLGPASRISSLADNFSGEPIT